MRHLPPTFLQNCFADVTASQRFPKFIPKLILRYHCVTAPRKSFQKLLLRGHCVTAPSYSFQKLRTPCVTAPPEINPKTVSQTHCITTAADFYSTTCFSDSAGAQLRLNFLEKNICVTPLSKCPAQSVSQTPLRHHGCSLGRHCVTTPTEIS